MAAQGKTLKNHVPSKRWEHYKVEGGTLKRTSTCPKCGPGMFFAQHDNRFYCGKCHYVEMKTK